MINYFSLMKQVKPVKTHPSGQILKLEYMKLISYIKIDHKSSNLKKKFSDL